MTSFSNPKASEVVGHANRMLQCTVGIESIEDALVEDKYRIWRSIFPARDVAEGILEEQISELFWPLETASDIGSTVRTLASKAAFRRFRIPWIRHVVALVQASEGYPVSFATLLPRSLEIPDEGLESFNPEAVNKAFKSFLNRRGIDKCKGWLIAGLHGEYDSIGGVWRIHWHLLVCGEMIKVINDLRDEEDFKSAKGEAPRVRMSRKPLTDIQKVASYLLQSWWPNRPKGNFADDGIDHRKHRSRLPEPQQTRWLLWMHQRKLSDLVLLIGVRRTTSGFKISKL